MNEISKYIEYTNLSAIANKKQIEDLCETAINYGFHAVCVHPFYIKDVKELLKGSQVKICTVVGFPLGQNTTKTKIYEAHDAIKKGANEIDMVINFSRLKAGDVEYCLDEINTIKRVCGKRPLKVIVETCLLTQEELELACQIVLESNADFIKTSTGFNGNGANVKNIEIIKAIVEDNKGIKASGGIKTYEDATAMIKAGATRIGTSALYPEINPNSSILSEESKTPKKSNTTKKSTNNKDTSKNKKK